MEVRSYTVPHKTGYIGRGRLDYQPNLPDFLTNTEQASLLLSAPCRLLSRQNMGARSRAAPGHGGEIEKKKREETSMNNAGAKIVQKLKVQIKSKFWKPPPTGHSKNITRSRRGIAFFPEVSEIEKGTTLSSGVPSVLGC